MKAQLLMTGVGLAAAICLAAPSVVAQTTKPGDQSITVSGCVQRESDYRKAMDKGKGGVVGTGVGAENEYVLTNVSMSDAAMMKKVGIDAMTAYELTGANEKLAAPHVNHRVEVTGVLKAAEVGAGGKPTGGASAGTPPRGIDVTSKDLQLREIEVSAVKMVAATCP